MVKTIVDARRWVELRPFRNKEPDTCRQIFDYFSDGVPFWREANIPGFSFEKLDRVLRVWRVNDRIVYMAAEEGCLSILGFVESLRQAKELRIWLLIGVEPSGWGDGKQPEEESDGVEAVGYAMLAVLLFFAGVVVVWLLRWFYG